MGLACCLTSCGAVHRAFCAGAVCCFSKKEILLIYQQSQGPASPCWSPLFKLSPNHGSIYKATGLSVYFSSEGRHRVSHLSALKNISPSIRQRPNEIIQICLFPSFINILPICCFKPWVFLAQVEPFRWVSMPVCILVSWPLAHHAM